MTTLTFVLVLIIGPTYRGEIATVPGYESIEKCREAGKAWSDSVSKSRDWNWQCIPGPNR